MINLNKATRLKLSRLHKTVARLPLSYIYDIEMRRMEDAKFTLSYLDALSDWIHSDCNSNEEACVEIQRAIECLEEVIRQNGL